MEVSPQYVAGFFDGEGHLDRKYERVHFTQRDPSILLAIQAVYGGRLRLFHKRAKSGRECYRLDLRSAESRRFKEEVGPYSRKLGGWT
jgi:hypothetical protein